MVWYHKFAFARNLRNCVEVDELTNENFYEEDEENEDDIKSEEEMAIYQADSLDTKRGLQQDQFESLHDDSTMSNIRHIQLVSANSVDMPTPGYAVTSPAETITEIVHFPLPATPAFPPPLIKSDRLTEAAAFHPSIHSLFQPKSVPPALSLGSPRLEVPTSPVHSHVSPMFILSTPKDTSQLLTTTATTTSSSTSSISTIYSTPQHKGALQSSSPQLSSPALSPTPTASTSPLLSMQSPLSSSMEQIRQPPFLAALGSSMPSVNTPLLTAPAFVEQDRHSLFLKSIFSPISALTQNNLRSEEDGSFFITASGDNEAQNYTSPKINSGRESVYETSKSMLQDLLCCEWDHCYDRFDSINEFFEHVNSHVQFVGKSETEFSCKWFGCTRNGKGFDARYKLLVHIRAHTNEKPYRCSTCGKQFSRKENMKIHVRSHTGEKPYICKHEGCSKAFSNTSDRLKHFRTHKEERPYSCKIPGCEKSYTDPSSLRKHIKSQSHSKIKTLDLRYYHQLAEH